MTKQFWINLPVVDTNKSKEFYTKVGFSTHTPLGNSDQVQLVIGDHQCYRNAFSDFHFQKFHQT